MTTEKSLRRNIATSDQVIICPNCQKKIPLTEAISHQIREKFETEFKRKENEIKEKLEKEVRQKAEEEIALELKDLREQVEEKNEEVQKAQKAEIEIRKRERELEKNNNKKIKSWRGFSPFNPWQKLSDLMYQTIQPLQ